MIDNPFTMVVLIVAIAVFGSVWRARYHHATRSGAGTDNAETKRLREEVEQLRDRLAVLERITVEKENSLAREIESLRDR